MIELNLLPDVKKEFIRTQRARNKIITISFFAMIIAGGIVLAFGFYVYAVQSVHVLVLNEQIKKNSAELKEVDELDKYLTIQNQLDKLGDLHGNKAIYSRLMDYLVKLNPSPPNGVTLTSLELAEEDKAITLNGNSASFESFNVFKDTLENAELTFNPSSESEDDEDAELKVEKLFDDVLVESSSISRDLGEGIVVFTVRLTYNPNAFSANLSNVSIRVPNIETTPSVQNAPRPVFNGTIEDDEEEQQ